MRTTMNSTFELDISFGKSFIYHLICEVAFDYFSFHQMLKLLCFFPSRTNIYINPPVAPPLVGGYGYGSYYGGWGWSPFSFFVPGPSVAIGLGGGFDLLALFLFLGAAAAVVRKFFGSREDEEDY